MKYLLVFSIFTTLVLGSTNLVQIYPANKNEIQTLADLQIPAIAQMEDTYIGQLDENQLSQLGQNRIEYRTICPAPSPGEYYIVTPPEAIDLNYAAAVISQYAQVLLTYKSAFLVVGQPQLIEQLPELRYHIAYINRQPIVLEQRVPPDVKSSSKYNAVVKWVIDQITPGELAQMIRDFSGENPVTIGGRVDTILSRYSSNPKNSSAIKYYYQKAQSYGVDSVVYQSFSGRLGIDSNVIATRVGRIYPRQQYLIGGHIDDVPASGRAPGADDNLTGTMAGLIAAKYIQGIPFKRTIKFVAWNAEEQGLYGSAAYASAARSRGDSIRGYFNGDMIAYEVSSRDSIRCYNGGRAGSIILSNKFNQMNIDYSLGLRIRLSTSAPTNSDHYSFWRNGYEALDIYEDDPNPYYHTANDRITTLDTIFYTKVVKCMVAALLELAEPDTAFPGVAEGNQRILDSRTISLKPNPARRSALFMINDPQFENGKLKIFDITGKLVSNFKVKSSLVLTLNPGVYFAKYFCGNEMIIKKFVMLE